MGDINLAIKSYELLTTYVINGFLGKNQFQTFFFGWPSTPPVD